MQLGYLGTEVCFGKLVHVKYVLKCYYARILSYHRKFMTSCFVSGLLDKAHALTVIPSNITVGIRVFKT